jgi:CRP-like cAMP-binding protein
LLNRLREMGMSLPLRGYAAEEVIEWEGKRTDGLCIVAEGVVSLRAEYAGYAGRKQATLGLVGPWESFGYPAFLAGSRVTSIEAFTECKIVTLPRASLERAVRLRPELALTLSDLMEAALRFREEMVWCLFSRRAQVRLARSLMLLAGRFGRDTGGGGTAIILELNHQHLADLIAATRETIGPILRRLREHRILEVDGAFITILDPPRLAGIARETEVLRA